MPDQSGMIGKGAHFPTGLAETRKGSALLIAGLRGYDDDGTETRPVGDNAGGRIDLQCRASRPAL
jgi:hypothetical protein